MAANEGQQKLGQMLKAAPDQVVAIEKSIASVQDQITELGDEAGAVEDALLDVSQGDLVDYLENVKLPEIEILYGSAVEVSYGPTFGSRTWGPPKGNISDWAIIDSTTTVDVYVYLGIGWDGDTTITELITDYDFGNDYLYRPLTDGATYGIYPSQTAMIAAKALLQQNSNKVNNSIDVFSDYV